MLAALASFSTGQGAQAAGLFRIEVSNSYGAIAVPGNDFVKLVEDLFSQEGEFSILSEFSEYSIDIDFLGITGAIQATVADEGEVVSLQLPLSGSSLVFTGLDVDEQIEDWLREDGNGDWARFVKEVNARSPLALLDGNPRSTTALMAGSAFQKFGLRGPSASGSACRSRRSVSCESTTVPSPTTRGSSWPFLSPCAPRARIPRSPGPSRRCSRARLVHR
jgi:hypothetical protein